MDIDIDNTYSRVLSNGNPMIGAGSVAAIYVNSTGEKAAVTVNGNTVIKAHGYNNVYGVNANGNAEIKLHGDLTMAKDGDKWAVENVIDGKTLLLWVNPPGETLPVSTLTVQVPA